MMMKVMFSISILLLVLACSSWAYEENFDTGEAEGWKVNTGGWEVDDGEYVCAQGGANEYTFFEESVNNADWKDYTFEVQVKPVSGSYAGVLFRVQEPSAVGGGWNTGKFYYWLIGITASGEAGYSKVWKAMGGKETVLDVAADTLKQGEWNDVKIELAGDNVKIYLRGVLQKEFTQDDFDGDRYDYGGIGLAAYSAEMHFDNVKVAGVGTAAVDSAGKLTTTWGHLKAACSL